MITLDLTPTEEAEITTIARQTGLTPADYLERLVKEQLPPQQDSEKKRAAAVTLLESWIAAQPTDPGEIRRGDAERTEFLQNLNRSRIDAGETPLYP